MPRIPTLTRRGLGVQRWERINMVDQGADPNGEEDVSSLIDTVLDEEGQETLLYFPQGTYLIESPAALSEQHSGLYGDGSNTTFIAGIGDGESEDYWTVDNPQPSAGRYLFDCHGPRTYLADVSVDLSERGAAPLSVTGQTTLVERVSVRGVDDSDTATPRVHIATDFGTVAHLREFSMPDGVATNPSNRAPLAHLGPTHSGAATLENCTLLYGADGALDISPESTGRLYLLGGELGNSGRAALHIRGEGEHYGRGFELRVDDRRAGFATPRALWIEQESENGVGVSSGHLFEDFTAEVTNVANAAQSIFVSGDNVGDVELRYCSVFDYRGGSASGADTIDIDEAQVDESPGEVYLNHVFIERGPGRGRWIDCARDGARFEELGFREV